jgi:hypothetical protein
MILMNRLNIIVKTHFAQQAGVLALHIIEGIVCMTLLVQA